MIVEVVPEKSERPGPGPYVSDHKKKEAAAEEMVDPIQAEADKIIKAQLGEAASDEIMRQIHEMNKHRAGEDSLLEAAGTKQLLEDIMAYKNSIWTQAVGNL